MGERIRREREERDTREGKREGGRDGEDKVMVKGNGVGGRKNEKAVKGTEGGKEEGRIGGK